jgi:hypothetical protein
MVTLSYTSHHSKFGKVVDGCKKDLRFDSCSFLFDESVVVVSIDLVDRQSKGVAGRSKWSKSG